MNYLGIDIAKNTHVAAAVCADGEVILKSFSFSNDLAGFCKLKEKIALIDKSDLLVGMESTAHYGENLINFLFNLGYSITIINPLQTAALRKSAIRKTKTDKVDSLLICKALMVYEHVPLAKRDIHIISLRALCNAYQNITHLTTRSKLQLGAYVDQIFPELNTFFSSGIHINTVHQLLKRHQSPDEIKNLHLTYLTNLLQKYSHNRFKKPKAIALKELAAASVGINNPSLHLQMRQAIAQIEFFNAQKAEVKIQIRAIMDEINSTIMTIPGIGYTTGAKIISCIGSISRFQSPNQLLAYAGLDPSVNQSGQFNARSTRMSKRGNSMLRGALIQAAYGAVKYNTTFHSYYSGKVAQGKSHYNALGHTAHKLVRVIFTLLSKNIVFESNKLC